MRGSAVVWWGDPCIAAGAMPVDRRHPCRRGRPMTTPRRVMRRGGRIRS